MAVCVTPGPNWSAQLHYTPTPLMAALHYSIPSFPIVKFVIYHVTAWVPLKLTLPLLSFLSTSFSDGSDALRWQMLFLPTFADLDRCLFVQQQAQRESTLSLLAPLIYKSSCMCVSITKWPRFSRHPSLCFHCMSYLSTASEKLIKHVKKTHTAQPYLWSSVESYSRYVVMHIYDKPNVHKPTGLCEPDNKLAPQQSWHHMTGWEIAKDKKRLSNIWLSS